MDKGRQIRTCKEFMLKPPGGENHLLGDVLMGVSQSPKKQGLSLYEILM